MTSENPYLTRIEEAYEVERLSTQALLKLAIIHELREMNRGGEKLDALTAAPESIGDWDPGRRMALPDDSGDARIAAAARRWAKAYGARNEPGGGGAAVGLAASELAEAIRQEDGS